MFTPTPNTATGADHARANADIDRLNAAKMLKCDGCSLVRTNVEAINATDGFVLWCGIHGLVTIGGATIEQIDRVRAAKELLNEVLADIARENA